MVEEKKIDGLAILADGMGGEGGGEQASSIATLIVTDEILKAVDSNAQIDANVLRDAILKADAVLSAVNNKTDNNMGTTMVVALTNKDNQTFVVGIGDSRIYRRNKPTGDVQLVTSDQSVVWNNFLMNDSIKPSGVFTHGLRNHLSVAIHGGGLTNDTIVVSEEKLTEDDQLILCCDGVWEAVPKDNEATQQILAEIDQQYDDKVANGMSRSDAAKIAFGEIFRRINLEGLGGNPSGDQIANYLTREEAGKLGNDNVTAVVVETSNN